jgi:hypothetical protein
MTAFKRSQAKRNAQVKPEAAILRERNRNIRSRARLGKRKRHTNSGYGRRSLVENTVYRYKTIIGPAMRSRTLPGQRVEARVGCVQLWLEPRAVRFTLDAGFFGNAGELASVLVVVVRDDDAGNLPVGRELAWLFRRPPAARGPRHSDMDNFTGVEADDQEDEDRAKPNVGGLDKVAAPDLLRMILQTLHTVTVDDLHHHDRMGGDVCGE